MLTCYGHEVRLPQIDLVYVAFRLAALETLCEIDMLQDLDGADDGPFGYLTEVPFLEQVAPAVQVELLADVWKRHQDVALHETSLLDAAVVYASFRTGARILNDEPKLARQWLKAGPRQVRCGLGSRAAEKLNELFFEFWDDIDFLSISELQDLEPNHAQQVRELMSFDEADQAQMEEVLTRWLASPSVVVNLEGLLTTEEINHFGPLLTKAIDPG